MDIRVQEKKPPISRFKEALIITAGLSFGLFIYYGPAMAFLNYLMG